MYNNFLSKFASFARPISSRFELKSYMDAAEFQTPGLHRLGLGTNKSFGSFCFCIINLNTLTTVFSTFQAPERSWILVSTCDVEVALRMLIYDIALICMYVRHVCIQSRHCAQLTNICICQYASIN